jgi:TRAP-type C4-dicarboxylate transport system permease large subunit
MPALILRLVLGLTQNKYLILLLINVILLINGCFLDLTASLYIYTPIFYPIAMALGIDPIHLGMILVINMDLGLLTP